MEIIKLTKDMASKASHIYALSWKAAYKNIVPQEYLDELSLERWTPFLTNSPYSGFLLKDGEEFVATSSISAARDEKMQGWGEIIAIYVLPKYYNQGYGKKLFAYVVAELQQQGNKNIYLWVLEENHQARAFYERNNFSPNGDKALINIGGREIAELRYTNCRE